MKDILDKGLRVCVCVCVCVLCVCARESGFYNLVGHIIANKSIIH